MGGVSVFVRRSFSQLVRRVCDNFEFGLILILDRSLLGLEIDCMFCALYFPPQESPFYQNVKQSAWRC